MFIFFGFLFLIAILIWYPLLPHPLCRPSISLEPIQPLLQPQRPAPLPPAWMAGGGIGVLPQVGFQDAVQALVEWPGSVIACPVVVLPVRIGEEIATQHRKPWRPGPWFHPCPLVQSIKVVREGAKLGLWEPQNPTPISARGSWKLQPQHRSQSRELGPATQRAVPGPRAQAGGLGKNSDRKGEPCPESGMKPCFGAGTGTLEPHCKGWAVALLRPLPRCPACLHVQVRLAVEEVKEPLVVGELSIPLLGLVVAEVITQRHQQDVASEEPGLLAVLVQEQGGPEGRKGTSVRLCVTGS